MCRSLMLLNCSAGSVPDLHMHINDEHFIIGSVSGVFYPERFYD